MKTTSYEASIYSMFIYRLQKRLNPTDLPLEGHHFFNHYTYRYILNTTDNVERITQIRVALKEAKKELE